MVNAGTFDDTSPPLPSPPSCSAFSKNAALPPPSERKIIYLHEHRNESGVQAVLDEKNAVRAVQSGAQKGATVSFLNGGYASVVEKRMTVQRGNESYGLTAEDMRRLWLHMRLTPRPGDLFRRSEWATDRTFRVLTVTDTLGGPMVEAEDLKTDEHVRIPTEMRERSTRASYFPVLPGGLNFPFAQWQFQSLRQRDWTFTRAGEQARWLVLEHGVTATLDFMNIAGFGSIADRDKNLADNPLGIFAKDRSKPTYTTSARIEDASGDFDAQIAFDAQQGRVTTIRRGAATYDMTSASLARLRAAMLADPITGDEFWIPMHGQVYVVGVYDDELALREVPTGIDFRLQKKEFAGWQSTPMAAPLMPSGLDFPALRSARTIMRYDTDHVFHVYGLPPQRVAPPLSIKDLGDDAAHNR